MNFVMLARNKKTAKREMDMLYGPLMKNMILYSIPIVFSGILQLLFNAADIAVVGRFTGAGEPLANKGKFIKIKVRYEPICMRRRKKMFKFKNEALMKKD